MLAVCGRWYSTRSWLHEIHEALERLQLAPPQDWLDS